MSVQFATATFHEVGHPYDMIMNEVNDWFMIKNILDCN